ncbi:MAG: flagellar assembly peptidoglycan hydrolase FlgJ [Pseudomonadales bacterium]|nr:flagellar assembly peptidoglycan hydrolase FlgJ [Pseudomonadales bacterium]
MRDVGLSNYNDLSALQALKMQASQGKDPKTLQQVARQFESLYISMMLKTMREATRSLNPDDPLSSKQSQFYEDMFDSQMSLYMSQHGGVGLEDVLMRQLGGQSGRVSKAPVSPLPRTTSLTSAPSRQEQQDFVDQIMPHAQAAARSLGISPRVIVAQAALETGWGQTIKRGLKNLFGIKADAGWQGARSRSSTLEVNTQGELKRTHADFRNYASVAASMDDYVHFLKSHPRYRQALQAGTNEQDFIQRLSAAGYASDPHYAAKLARIMNGISPSSVSSAG